MNYEPADVCSITGKFTEKHTPGEDKLFGGFIAVMTSPERKDGELMPFVGGVVDIYGSSSLEGRISDFELKFRKTYEKDERIIDYQFEKNSEGLWVGTYSGFGHFGGKIEGNAVARTNKDWHELNLISPETGPDQWTKYIIQNTIQNMVDSGTLVEVSGDAETN